MFDRYYPRPAISVGTITDSNGELQVAGQTYTGSPQVGQFRAALGAPVVSVKVGRKQAVIGVGGFYAPRTTH